MRKLGLVIALFAAFALVPAAQAQSEEVFAKSLHIYDSYRVVPNITYLNPRSDVSRSQPVPPTQKVITPWPM
jgi:hypothetical protein